MVGQFELVDGGGGDWLSLEEGGPVFLGEELGWREEETHVGEEREAAL